MNVKGIYQNMDQEISSYSSIKLPVEVHVAGNIKIESAWVPVFNILKEPLLISNSKWGCFFMVIFLFSVFWKHHEDDTNVLPYCTIIVDSKGGWPCEKAWYSKCLYLMVCYEIEMGIHSLCSETFVIYFFHTWSMKISGIQILSALLQVG